MQNKCECNIQMLFHKLFYTRLLYCEREEELLPSLCSYICVLVSCISSVVRDILR